MKWKISQSTNLQKKVAESEPACFEVDLADALKQRRPAIGEVFEIKLQRPDSNVWKTLQCQFVGDGKSIKIGHDIVRLASLPLSLKKDLFRVRAGSSHVVAYHTLKALHLRPVTPVKNNLQLSDGHVKSPMTGKVIKVLVSENQEVNEGDILVVVEAMKMENQIRSECQGFIQGIRIREGQSVSVDELLLSVQSKPAPTPSKDTP